MNFRKPILLIAFLLAWLGGTNGVWAVDQSGENNYVRYLTSSQGFNIQFKYNGDWQKTTFNDGGYKTVVKVGNNKADICSSGFQFGQEYVALDIGVTIVASINAARPWSVNIKYIIRNTTDSPITFKLGSWADTQVGNDDSANIEREGHNTIMMTSSSGAMYGITAGTDPFTTLWYGYYGSASSNVFNDNGGVYDGTSGDSGLAWSWDITLPANGTKEIEFGGLAPSVQMAGYTYGGTLSTPSITIEGNPSITYYYNTTGDNTSGTPWTNVTSSTYLNAGSYYIYAHVEPENSEPAYNTPTTPFRVARAAPQASDFAFTAPSILMYDGTQKTASVVTHLTGGKTGMGDVAVKYFRGATQLSSAPTDVGTYIVKIDVTQGNNYSAATDVTTDSWTFSITKRPITTTAITVADLAYNAADQTTAGRVTVTYNGFTIPAENYTVEPATVKEAGTYTLTITGKNNLSSFITKKLKVTKAMNGIYTNDFTVSDIPTQIYKGMAVQPTVSVYDNGRLLTESIDYTVSYGTNHEEGTGTGTITINGAGAYTGGLNRTFAIVKEFFKKDEIVYRATSSTTVAVVDKDPNNPTTVTTTATGAVAIPATVEHIVTDAFLVTGIKTGAFKDRTDITGISMPHATVYLTYIEDGAFEGCAALRYIDLCNATSFVPASLERTVTASPFYGVPKQALVYLNGTAIAGENYVYKPGNSSDYLCDEFKIYDDMNGSQTGFTGSDYQWPFENRHNFKAKYIINTRKFVAGQHYTLCLPYDMDIPESFKVYQLVGANTASSLIGFQEVTGNRIEFQTPYVIIPTVTGQLLGTTEEYVHEFKEERTDKTTLNPVTGGDFKMYGTLRYVSGDEANGKYIMQSGNAWKRIYDSPAYDGACILPMRAYISGGSSAARTYLSASFTDAEHNTTTVEQLRLDEDTEGTTIYGLQGRKIQTPQHKGIYIINGRKVVK